MNPADNPEENLRAALSVLLAARFARADAYRAYVVALDASNICEVESLTAAVEHLIAGSCDPDGCRRLTVLRQRALNTLREKSEACEWAGGDEARAARAYDRALAAMPEERA